MPLNFQRYAILLIIGENTGIPPVIHHVQVSTLWSTIDSIITTINFVWEGENYCLVLQHYIIQNIIWQGCQMPGMFGKGRSHILTFEV